MTAGADDAVLLGAAELVVLSVSVEDTADDGVDEVPVAGAAELPVDDDGGWLVVPEGAVLPDDED